MPYAEQPSHGLTEPPVTRGPDYHDRLRAGTAQGKTDLLEALDQFPTTPKFKSSIKSSISLEKEIPQFASRFCSKSSPICQF